ncbi:MAG TPA: M28 family peptidase [Gemmatimonadales bacterium]|nr:M28 family peptidase [Gemmatimonadota bacterium]HPF61565.1 M28 family peptidase [Gemmatimonadales bacterium]HRX19195.1 M28 family peptidase [Gemmatimonadales bacterium]
MRPAPRRLAALALLAGLPACAGGQASCPVPIAIDSTALMRDLYRLADDSLAGRLIGSPGNLKARDYLAARFDAIGLGTLPFGRLQRVSVTPSPRLPGVTEGWNVIGTIPGTEQPERYLVVTAHYDHVGIGRPVDGDSIYNGSDDNASGAAALAVLARHFQQAPLRHTLVFAAVDGEERGMWGSRGLVEPAVVPVDRIDLNVNMDMISRNVAGELYAAGPGRYPALVPLVDATARCAPVTLRRGHDTDAVGRADDWTTQSDHVVFHRLGIPFVYFGVEDHPDYHRPGDSPDRAMPGFYVGAVRTVADLIRRADDFRR